MDSQLALRVLGQIMDWDDNQANQEFRWLQLMGKIKYDGYEDYRAGVRFLESLARWLQQFEKSERAEAYKFIRERLIYVSPAEFQRLVQLFYPRTLEPLLVDRVARKLGIPAYRVWVDMDARQALENLKRRTLILALSEGARIDQLRRATLGILSNEQFVGMTEVHEDKWKRVLSKLREDQGEGSRFEIICLVDDFMGTGTSFLRKEGGRWTGKLVRFKDVLHNEKFRLDDFVEPDWIILVHHYLGGPDANQVVERERKARNEHDGNWVGDLRFEFGLRLPESIKVNSARDAAFSLLAAKYYNSAIEDEHTAKGGVERIDFGYGACALPLVLEHNTPNNSMALLWADCPAQGEGLAKEPEMRPLFRRRIRHTS
jgi:hypothetical protein